jgi:GDPmannose 4,6-dehydratase
MKKALIIGVSGQDGFYLTKLLAEKKYQIYGLDRDVDHISEEQGCLLTSALEFDLLNSSGLISCVEQIGPDEVYFLAAHHFSSQGNENRVGRMGPFLDINLVVPNLILEYIHKSLPNCRFFYAASAHIFGVPSKVPQDEETVHQPITPYAISKSAAVHLCKYYRETHGLYVASGILYNHESVRRQESFVTTQIAIVAAKAFLGETVDLRLRDLSAVVDWGAAEDYVRAMWLTLQQERGDEYVIASGTPRSIMDFCVEAFSFVGLDARDFVGQVSPLSECGGVPYVGDSSKLRKVCGWVPEVTFEELVASMVSFHIDRLNNKDTICQ